MRHLILIAIIALSFSSCKIHKLNTEHKKFIESHEILSLEKTQFYNNKKIVLMRELSSEEAVNAKGIVKIKKGVHIEYVTLAKKTGGRYITQNADGNILTIAFEEGDYRNFYFKKYGSHYVLSQDGNLIISGTKLKYDGKEYVVANGKRAALLFKKDEKLKVSKSSRKIKGLEVE